MQAKMRITRIGRTYQQVQRYSQILTVLFRFGFGDLVERLKIRVPAGFGDLFFLRRRRDVKDRTTEERIRLAILELGPTFVKLGQVLSTRRDLLPRNLIAELTKLQDDVPPFAFEKVREIIESELGASLDSLYAEFGAKPIAAASIGQVHRARLISGEEVAVKVQRPGIRKRMEVDLGIIEDIAGLMQNRVEELRRFQPVRIVDHFARELMQELDFRREASHIRQFAHHFKDDKRVHIHRVYPRLSTSRVLTLEFIRGTKPTDRQALIDRGLDPVVLADRGSELMLQQIFDHRFFHADPHPGNLLIMEGNVISYLDFGMMGRIDRGSKEAVADLLIAAIGRNEIKTTDALMRLIRSDQEIPRWEVERRVAELLDRFIDQPLNQVRLDELLNRLFELAYAYRLFIPGDLFLLIKSLMMAEGLGRELDPDFDFSAKIRPFIKKIKLARISPQRILSDTLESATQLTYLLREIPGEVREILKQVKRGKIKMEFEHHGLDPMLNTHEDIANRITSAIVLASLIIGSSLIVLSGVPPKWHDIPIIGLVGYLVSGVMGFSLLLSIRRSHK